MGTRTTIALLFVAYFVARVLFAGSAPVQQQQTPKQTPSTDTTEMPPVDIEVNSLPVEEDRQRDRRDGDFNVFNEFGSDFDEFDDDVEEREEERVKVEEEMAYQAPNDPVPDSSPSAGSADKADYPSVSRDEMSSSAMSDPPMLAPWHEPKHTILVRYCTQ
jgi:hypothetical protein